MPAPSSSCGLRFRPAAASSRSKRTVSGSPHLLLSSPSVHERGVPSLVRAPMTSPLSSRLLADLTTDDSTMRLELRRSHCSQEYSHLCSEDEEPEEVADTGEVGEAGDRELGELAVR